MLVSHAVHCGDSLAAMRAMAARSVDVVITDPPYAAETHAGAVGNGGKSIPVDFASLNEAQLRESFAQIGRIVRRWVISTLDWRHVALLESQPLPGLRFVRFGVWVKPNGAPQFTGDRPATGWEAVAILHADDRPLRWNGGGGKAVWDIPRVNGAHPTEKPIALLTDFVRLFSERGETILDPFAGSGTTGVAAKLLGRGFLGYETNPKWAAHAQRRLDGTAEQVEMFSDRIDNRKSELLDWSGSTATTPETKP